MKIMEPNYSFWQEADVWKIGEAPDLLLGLQPFFIENTEQELQRAVEAQEHYIIVQYDLSPYGENWTEEATKALISSSTYKRRKRFARQVASLKAERFRLAALLRRAAAAGRIDSRYGDHKANQEHWLVPRSVVEWALSKGINVPEPLRTLLSVPAKDSFPDDEAAIGKRVREGGRKGSDRRRGFRKADPETVAAEYAKAREKNPHNSKTGLFKKVGEKCKISDKTVKNYVEEVEKNRRMHSD